MNESSPQTLKASHLLRVRQSWQITSYGNYLHAWLLWCSLTMPMWVVCGVSPCLRWWLIYQKRNCTDKLWHFDYTVYTGLEPTRIRVLISAWPTVIHSGTMPKIIEKKYRGQKYRQEWERESWASGWLNNFELFTVDVNINYCRNTIWLFWAEHF